MCLTCVSLLETEARNPTTEKTAYEGEGVQLPCLGSTSNLTPNWLALNTITGIPETDIAAYMRQTYGNHRYEEMRSNYENMIDPKGSLRIKRVSYDLHNKYWICYNYRLHCIISLQVLHRNNSIGGTVLQSAMQTTVREATNTSPGAPTTLPILSASFPTIALLNSSTLMCSFMTKDIFTFLHENGSWQWKLADNVYTTQNNILSIKTYNSSALSVDFVIAYNRHNAADEKNENTNSTTLKCQCRYLSLYSNTSWSDAAYLNVTYSYNSSDSKPLRVSALISANNLDLLYYIGGGCSVVLLITVILKAVVAIKRKYSKTKLLQIEPVYTSPGAICEDPNGQYTELKMPLPDCNENEPHVRKMPRADLHVGEIPRADPQVEKISRVDRQVGNIPQADPQVGKIPRPDRHVGKLPLTHAHMDRTWYSSTSVALCVCGAAWQSARGDIRNGDAAGNGSGGGDGGDYVDMSGFNRAPRSHPQYTSTYVNTPWQLKPSKHRVGVKTTPG